MAFIRQQSKLTQEDKIMAKHTSEEIEAIKTAVKPLTPEERARLRAIRDGEAPPESEAKPEEVSPALENALKARAMQLGVDVSGLTPEQVQEVKDAVVSKEEVARSRRSKRGS